MAVSEELDNCADTDDLEAVLATEAGPILDTRTDFGMLLSVGLPKVFEASAGLDIREAPFETELPPEFVPTFLED